MAPRIQPRQLWKFGTQLRRNSRHTQRMSMEFRTLETASSQVIGLLDMHFVTPYRSEDQDFYSPKIVGVERDF
jgi:hypothetical protein